MFSFTCRDSTLDLSPLFVYSSESVVISSAIAAVPAAMDHIRLFVHVGLSSKGLIDVMLFPALMSRDITLFRLLPLLKLTQSD